MLRLLPLLFLLASCACQPGPGQFAEGDKPALTEITRLFDGDSGLARAGGVVFGWRLSGVDCPEKNQPGGDAATALTRRLTSGPVAIVGEKQDRYGRVLVEIGTPEGDLSTALVEAGACRWYRKYAPDRADLEAAEKKARAGRRGIWRDENAVPPWEWRRINPAKF